MKKQENKPNEQTTNKELCVVCWKETEFDKDTPIELRQRYVRGVGQLCYDCWKELYGKDEK